MTLLPFSSTVMYAWPDSSRSSDCTAVVSTPSCFKIAICFLPTSSRPTQASKATWPAPSILEAATDTLPPLPPGTLSIFSTTTSWPDRGKCLTKRLMSQFRAPVIASSGGKDQLNVTGNWLNECSKLEQEFLALAFLGSVPECG